MAGERERLVQKLRTSNNWNSINPQILDHAADLLEADAAELAAKDKALHAARGALKILRAAQFGGTSEGITLVLDEIDQALASQRNEAKDKGENE